MCTLYDLRYKIASRFFKRNYRIKTKSSNKNKELQRYLYRPLPQRNSRQCKHIFFAKRDDPSSNYGKRKTQSKNNSVKSIGYNTDRRIILVQYLCPILSYSYSFSPLSSAFPVRFHRSMLFRFLRIPREWPKLRLAVG